jgi:hypothetical protein
MRGLVPSADSSARQPARVTAVVPIERIAEFVDEPLYGVLEVEPL